MVFVWRLPPWLQVIVGFLFVAVGKLCHASHEASKSPHTFKINDVCADDECDAWVQACVGGKRCGAALYCMVADCGYNATCAGRCAKQLTELTVKGSVKERQRWASLWECANRYNCLQEVPPNPWWYKFLRDEFYLGTYSLCPFIVFPIVGFAMASVIFSTPGDKASRDRQRKLGWAAIVCAIITTVGFFLSVYVDQTRGTWVRKFHLHFQSTPNATWLYVVWSFATIFALLWAFEPFNRMHNPSGVHRAVVWWFSLNNRYLLTEYICQHAAILHILYWYGRTYGEDDWTYWRSKIMTTPQALVLGYSYMFAQSAFFWAYEKYCHSLFLPEWWVRVVTWI